MISINLVPYLATLAAMLMLVGFTFRDQMWLRTFAILGSLSFIVFCSLVSDVPLWSAIITTLAVIGVNLWMMWVAVKDNRTFRLSAEEMMLYAKLPGVAPGQFKQLLAIAEWHNPSTALSLTQEGEMPSALHYVLEGRVMVNKSGKTFSVGPHAFIGELAFLRNKPATATTAAQPGALIVSWRQEALRNLMKSNDGIRRAIDELLSVDMAEKIANTGPPLLQEQKR